MSNGENLLILTHSYASFVKDQVDIIAKSYKNIDVLVRRNPIADLSNYLPINYLKPFSSKAVLDVSHKPDNVHVFQTPILYAPTDSGYKKLSRRHFLRAEKAINTNNLKFDFIHAHFTVSAGYAGAKLKEKYGVPLVVTAHGIDIYDIPFRDQAWKEQVEFVLNTADRIITVSNNNYDCIKKLDVRTPVKVIPNGYNSHLFYPLDTHECRKRLNLPADKKIILAVGSLFPIKGHTYLIGAIQKIVNSREDVLCVIVGDGESYEKLRKQVKNGSLEKYVLLAGRKPHSEIPLWMNACDLFVLPSLNESFGVVQVEAMACGKPVVATINGGSEEVVTSDEHGLLCPPANSDELANAILNALGKEWDSQGIVEYAKKYRWENITEEIVNLYRTL